MSEHSQAVAVRPERIPDPRTGEVLTLKDATPGQLAEAIDRIRAYKRDADAAIKTIGHELNARLDKRAAWTLRADGYEIKGRSPAVTTEYDAEPLYRDLRKLVKAGTIDQEALDNAVEREVSYKPKAGGLKKLAAAIPAAKEVIGKHAREVTPVRGAPKVEPIGELVRK